MSTDAKWTIGVMLSFVLLLCAIVFQPQKHYGHENTSHVSSSSQEYTLTCERNEKMHIVCKK